MYPSGYIIHVSISVIYKDTSISTRKKYVLFVKACEVA